MLYFCSFCILFMRLLSPMSHQSYLQLDMEAARASRNDEYATEEAAHDAEQSPKRRKEVEPTTAYVLVLPAASNIQPERGAYLYVVHLQDVETLPTVSAKGERRLLAVSSS